MSKKTKRLRAEIRRKDDIISGLERVILRKNDELRARERRIADLFSPVPSERPTVFMTHDEWSTTLGAVDAQRYREHNRVEFPIFDRPSAADFLIPKREVHPRVGSFVRAEIVTAQGVRVRGFVPAFTLVIVSERDRSRIKG